MTYSSKWTIQWPNREGWFWFWGFPWGKSDRDKADLYACKVKGPVWSSNNKETFLVDTCNAFIHKHEAVGLWREMEVPDVSSMDAIRSEMEVGDN